MNSKYYLKYLKYKHKYLKYKHKYLNIKKLSGGAKFKVGDLVYHTDTEQKYIINNINEDNKYTLNTMDGSPAPFTIGVDDSKLANAFKEGDLVSDGETQYRIRVDYGKNEYMFNTVDGKIYPMLHTVNGKDLVKVQES